MKARIIIYGIGFLLGTAASAIELPQNMPTNNFQNSLAYRTAALERMNQEASWACIKLRLISQPFQTSDITRFFVVPPRKMGFGGTMQTTNYYFRFARGGKLDEICDQSKHPERFEMYPVWAKTPSSVDTNGAYQLATQWLRAISVDVAALEKKYKLNFYQWFYWGRETGVPDSEWNQYPPTTNKVMLPIYDVRWGEGSPPPVKVTVFGPTKELAALELNDISFSRRPPIVITNWEELLNIPDPSKKQIQVPSSPDSAERTNPPPATQSKPPPPFQRRLNAGEPR